MVKQPNNHSENTLIKRRQTTETLGLATKEK